MVQSLGGVRARGQGRPCRRGPLRRNVATMSSASVTSELIITDESRVKAKRAALVAGGLGNLQVRARTARSLSVWVRLQQKTSVGLQSVGL